MAQEHGAQVLEPLSEADRRELGRLLGALATHHGLSPGVHPGYRTMGPPPGDARRPPG